ncbi:hypothetical protein ILYODFUR_014167 [Ilyodon furcidens]|uniref:Uncharacterized protein n=1 Tax=Ilyodon furcidens TaxID=33524 RepID=A0ABV0UFY9_9TELE
MINSTIKNYYCCNDFFSYTAAVHSRKNRSAESKIANPIISKFINHVCGLCCAVDLATLIAEMWKFFFNRARTASELDKMTGCKQTVASFMKVICKCCSHADCKCYQFLDKQLSKCDECLHRTA